MRKPRRDVSIRSLIHPYEEPRPFDWPRIFGRTGSVEVEIGCGLGEYLSQLACEDPSTLFIGIEKEWFRIKKALHRLSSGGALDQGIWDGSRPLSNARILPFDARVAFERMFAPQSLKRVHCLFPCPWPKKGHVKHRLFSRSFFQCVNNRLHDAGEVRIVTDHEPYGEWLLEQIADTGFRFSLEATGPRFATKFEKKWVASGQEKFFSFTAVKVRHVAFEFKEDANVKTFLLKDFHPEKFVFPDKKGPLSIIGKDFLFDPVREKGLVRLVVAEKGITQHVWVTIARVPEGWYLGKTLGQFVIPTMGVAEAVSLVFEAARRTTEN